MNSTTFPELVGLVEEQVCLYREVSDWVYSFTSIEYLNLDISNGNSTLRLVTTYRPPRSKKNCSTPATFFSALYTTGNSYQRLWLTAVERRFQFPHGCWHWHWCKWFQRSAWVGRPHSSQRAHPWPHYWPPERYRAFFLYDSDGSSIRSPCCTLFYGVCKAPCLQVTVYTASP